MRVLVVGSGGREHALASRIARSPLVTAVFCAPGNAGTASVAKNLAVPAEDVSGIVRAAKEHAIDFVVVGPEAPLVAGVVDALEAESVLAFGPRAAGARLEGSKAWSKQFMRAHGVPTAAFETFTDADAAAAFVERSGKPWVVKADGLAAGKGVIVAADVAETLDAIERIMRQREFGGAGAEVVLEERLLGQEVSYHVVLDGKRFLPLAAAQDHKRLRAGDSGPNTGGMGAYSPPPVVTREVEQRILERVVEPSVRGLAAEKIEFRGVLFIGLMIDAGEPRVLEYNTRFGDPECEVLLARFGGDIVPLLLGAARGDLSGVELRWDTPSAMGVVLAAPGYPGSVKKGLPIAGLDRAAKVVGVEVLHAGTQLSATGVATSGGRVLCVTGAGPDLDTVAARVYDAVSCIEFEGMQYRNDIGHHTAQGLLMPGLGPDVLARLVALLRQAGVVACPTETFIGLLADARNSVAVAEVCRLKGRAADQPIGVLIPDLAALDSVALHVPARARELAARHWPGPLSLVLRARPELPEALQRGGTVSVRVPGPSPALDLVRAFGAALTATSANRSGEPAAKNAAEVRAVFGDALAAIAPGESPGGLASTIVDATGETLKVLRAGPIVV